VKTDRVQFTKPEAEWLARNIKKTMTILEASAKKDPKVLERVTYKTLKNISEKAPNKALEDGGHEFIFTRKQKQSLQLLVLQTLTVLNDKIIPEYQRRGLTEYLQDAKMKSEILSGMYRKLK
jgi:hypothetical protein